MATTVLLHHPQIRKEIRRNHKQAAILAESGWREGPLPPKEEPAQVTPTGQEEPASAAPAKKAASVSTSKNEGK